MFAKIVSNTSSVIRETASGHKSASQTRLTPSPSGEGRVRCEHTASWDCRGGVYPPASISFSHSTPLSVGRGFTPAEKRNDFANLIYVRRGSAYLSLLQRRRGTALAGDEENTVFAFYILFRYKMLSSSVCSFVAATFPAGEGRDAPFL